MGDYYLIQGGQFEDQRGRVSFANTFDMTNVKRFYILSNQDTHVLRAWQGHKKETKWFFCQNGSFLINIIKTNQIDFPTGVEKVDCVRLVAGDNRVLCVPGGHYTGIKSESISSSLLIFSDLTLDHSREDDYRKEQNFWNFNPNPS
jgi:dTDP-4-dehydrorhamnose 3,5-epimerase-like enzyme